MREKIHSYLGLARRSGNLVTGYDTCIQLMKKRKIKLLIVTEDAAEQTRSKFLKLTEKNGIRMYVFSTTVDLSAITGMENRSVYGITDHNFASAIAGEIENMRE